jgi:hypothetical protein
VNFKIPKELDMAGACIKSIKQDDAKGFKDILVQKSSASW